MIVLNSIIKKYFIGKENELTVLKGIDLTINKSEFVAIVGQSGSGKSTLMNIIGALDKQTEGSYYLDGIDISRLTQDQLSEIRNEKIGFIFQNFNLIPRSSAISNVKLPMLYRGINEKDREKIANNLLNMVGMIERKNHYPNELSGGQKQRIAIARSLVNNPDIILADEPTGALDTETGNMVMNIFKKINREDKKTVIIITHSEKLALETDRIITIKDGRIISDIDNKNKKIKVMK